MILRCLRKRHFTTRFFKDEPSNLHALKGDGRVARKRIDMQTDEDRDRLLEKLLAVSYPEQQSQDC